MAEQQSMPCKDAKDDLRPFKLGGNAPDHVCISSPYYAGRSPAKTTSGQSWSKIKEEDRL